MKAAAFFRALIIWLACLLELTAASAEKSSSFGPDARSTPAPIHPFSETLYGEVIADPYRYMETLDAETIDWMRAQAAYTRRIFDAIGPRVAFKRRMADFGGDFSSVQAPSLGVQPYQVYGGRIFYTEYEPGSENLDLFVKDRKNGAHKLLDMAKFRAKNRGRPYAINYFEASPDGTKVAVGISAGGTEAASLMVYDAATGVQIAGPVDRAELASPTWSDDGRTLFFTRLAQTQPGDLPTAKYVNASAVAWDLISEPKAVVGVTVGNAEKFGLTPTDLPNIATIPGAANAVFDSVHGVQNEQEYWLAPIREAANPDAPWQRLAVRSDNVTSIDMRGEEIFLLSHQDAPTFKVLTLHAGQKLADAATLVPARSDRIIESIYAASDGLYVLAREGIYSRLLRVAAKDNAVQDIELPFKGYISAAFSDPRNPGLTFTLESWVVPATEFTYDPARGRFFDLKLETKPHFNPAQFAVRELQAKAGDGTEVPLTLVGPKNASGPQIVLLAAYGSYGISYLPEFSLYNIIFMLEGADTAVCHVRGGGELGEIWRLGGKDANKPNSWRDLIACGEDLIARGVTTRGQLFIISGSAGGITVGRAMTERPDLFAGVIDQVPVANPLRFEFSPNGPPNVPEFGTVTTEQGFRNLLAMDSYQAVKDGTQYPAVLITTGLNDPRVPSWQPAKFAARLQACGTIAPVLLRVEEEAGHGVGSTGTQKDEESADFASFVFWRAGRPTWQPRLPGTPPR